MALVDLFSDTQTRPPEPMRIAMADAEVGDEQRREDPTVLELERRVAELLPRGPAKGVVPAVTEAARSISRELGAPRWPAG